MNRKHRDNRFDRSSRRRHAIPGERRHHASIPLTEEGFPAAAPDVPRPSPTVFVSDVARASYPWLPPRVIAGSVWRGPLNERVRVDEGGNAAPWRSKSPS